MRISDWSSDVCSSDLDDRNIVALVDYFGREVTDSIECAQWFFDEHQLDEKGYTFGVRLDTNGERFLEGLDWDTSVEIVSKWLGVYPVDEYAVEIGSAWCGEGGCM